MGEVALTADELAALAGGVLPPVLAPADDPDPVAGARSLTARGAYDADGAPVAALAPVREVLAAPGLLAQVDVEQAGRAERTWLLATPALALVVRPLEDGRLGLRASPASDVLAVLVGLARLEDRPVTEGALTTTTSGLARAAAGGGLDGGEAFLRALRGRVRAVEVAVRWAPAPTRQVGCDLAWVDGGEHGLWVVPPFVAGEPDDVPCEVRATSREDLLQELAEALPHRAAQDT